MTNGSKPLLFGLLLGGIVIVGPARADDPQDDAWRFHAGPIPGRCLGMSVAAAGDVNADGTADYIVGAPYDGLGSGNAYVFSGSDGSIIHEFNGQANLDFFGFSVDGAGDVDNDGHADLIVGSPLHKLNMSDDPPTGMRGKVYIYSGASGLLIRSYQGVTDFGFMGYGVAGAGDLDGDGHDDVVIGTPHRGNGRVTVYSGADGSEIFTYTGQSTGAKAGFAVAGIGDVNNDGIDDIAAGMPGEGRVRILSGASGVVLRTFTSVSYTGFGQSLAGAGDVNNDGVPDLIVGAPAAGGGTTPAGMARVYSGANGTMLHTFLGQGPGRMGYAVGAAGDLDADGYDDVLIGAPSRRVGERNGLVEARSGATGLIIRHFRGPEDHSEFGAACCGIGDVSGDGTPDVLVGDYHYRTGNPVTGAAYVYSENPNTSGYAPSQSFAMSAGTARSLVSADINRDGLDDLIAIHTSSDRITIRKGRPDGSFKSLGSYIVGRGPIAVEPVDLDRDGDKDLVIALYRENRLAFYRNTGLGYFQRVGTMRTGRKPMDLASGDLNGDGYADLAVVNQNDHTLNVHRHRRYQSLALHRMLLSPRVYTTMNQPVQVEMLRSNSDARPDLLVASRAAGRATVLLNQPMGFFVLKRHTGLGSLPEDVLATDIDGDRIADLVYTNAGSGDIHVRLGVGDGRFGPASVAAVASLPRNPALFDMNLDGALDLAVSESGSADALIFNGNGQGAFGPATIFPFATQSTGLVAGDFDGDDDVDLAAASTVDNEVHVLHNTWD